MHGKNTDKWTETLQELSRWRILTAGEVFTASGLEVSRENQFELRRANAVVRLHLMVARDEIVEDRQPHHRPEAPDVFGQLFTPSMAATVVFSTASRRFSSRNGLLTIKSTPTSGLSDDLSISA